MSIDFTKPLQTCGPPLRLLCTDATGKYPVVCLRPDGTPITFTLDGEFVTGCSEDKLINVSEQVTVDVWINIYAGTTGFSTRDEALAWAAQLPGLRRHATLHIKRTVPVGYVDE